MKQESASNILIFLTIYSSSNDNHSQRLLRGSTVIETGGSSGSRSLGFGGGFNCGNDADIGTMTGIFLDAPNTTSYITYSVKGKVSSTTNSTTFRIGYSNSTSTLTLM